jgi:hypothetical protein
MVGWVARLALLFIWLSRVVSESGYGTRGFLYILVQNGVVLAKVHFVVTLGGCSLRGVGIYWPFERKKLTKGKPQRYLLREAQAQSTLGLA